MANKIAVDEDEIFGYIIDGISDMNLHDLVRVQGFTTREEMLQAFEEIPLDTWSHCQRSRGSTMREDVRLIKAL